jgi:hypothetical protein
MITTTQPASWIEAEADKTPRNLVERYLAEQHRVLWELIKKTQNCDGAR